MEGPKTGKKKIYKFDRKKFLSFLFKNLDGGLHINCKSSAAFQKPPYTSKKTVFKE